MTLILKQTPEERILAAADRLQPEIRRTFLRAVEELQKLVPVNDLADLLEAGKLTEAFRLLDDIQLTGTQLAPIRDALHEAARLAGRPLADEIGLSFKLVNPRAVRWAEDHAARLIVGIDSETRKAIRSIVVRGQREGINVRSQAQLIREIVGLTNRDARAVDRFYTGLVQDGRKNADVMRGRMARRLLRRRAENIARTETIRASNMGVQLTWRTAMDQGLLPQTARKVWIVTPDNRLCPLCAPLDGAVVGVAEPFQADVEATGFKVTSQTGTDRIEITDSRPTRPFTDLTPPRHPSCRCAIGLIFE